MAILHAAVGTHGNMCAQQAPSRIQQQLSTAPKQVRPCGVSGGTIEAAQFLQTALNQHVVPLVRRALSDSSNKVIITGKRGKAIVYSHEQQAPLHSFPIQTACQLSFELQPKQLRGKQGGRY